MTGGVALQLLKCDGIRQRQGDEEGFFRAVLQVRGRALVTGGAVAQVADGESSGGGCAQCATEVGRGGTVDGQREEGVADGFLPGLNAVQGLAALRGGL